MSLLEDLDNLCWPVTLKFSGKGMSRNEYYDFVDWCNDHFGMNGWFHDAKGRLYLRKEEHATLFLLRWL